MQVPKHLTGEIAKQFWRDLAPTLEADGVLNQTTKSAFATVCQTYEDYRLAEEPRWRAKFLDLWMKLAKPFGILPHAAVARATAVASKETTVDPGLSRLYQSIRQG